MQVIDNLAFGFSHALTIQNLLLCAAGCLIGMLVGLLPGLGPLATISLLLPLTFSLTPTGALIMLAGIYYGAQYGDNVSAITMKIPHASSIVACIDGYQMTLKGKTGVALFTAGVSSFIGGTVAIVVLAWLAPVLSSVAMLFGPVEYCALVMFGFVCVSFVTTGSVLDGLAMCLVGVLLGQVGSDIETGDQRFTLGLLSLADGIHLVSIALGCFGIAEIAKNLDSGEQRSPFNGPIHLIPSWPEFKRIFPSAIRGSIVGSLLGIMPGGGPVIAQFAAYAVDKKFSKYRDEIGQGAIEGVAGQAAADEAAARTSFIPLMSLGIPENAVMALMMAAFIINGVQPGPGMITKHPEALLGPRRQHVDRQLLPADPQRAAGADLALRLQDQVQLAVPGDPVLLLRRHFQRERQPARYFRNGRLRPAWLCLPAHEARSGAAHPRLHPRADAGGQFPPRHGDQPGQFRGLRHSADQCRADQHGRAVLPLAVRRLPAR